MWQQVDSDDPNYMAIDRRVLPWNSKPRPVDVCYRHDGSVCWLRVVEVVEGKQKGHGLYKKYRADGTDKSIGTTP